MNCQSTCEQGTKSCLCTRFGVFGMNLLSRVARSDTEPSSSPSACSAQQTGRGVAWREISDDRRPLTAISLGPNLPTWRFSLNSGLGAARLLRGPACSVSGSMSTHRHSLRISGKVQRKLNSFQFESPIDSFHLYHNAT